MKREEYFDLQSKIKTHFAWSRSKIGFWFNIVIILAIQVAVVLILDLIDRPEDSGIIFKFLGASSLFLLFFVLGKIMIHISLSTREGSVLKVLDHAYAQNKKVADLMYHPDFEQFFPCLDIDLSMSEEESNH